MTLPGWLEVKPGPAPLVVAFPHTGTELLPGLETDLVSPWRARRDTDWWIDRLYDFATDLGATTVRTKLSRSVIDVNRDPSGRSLYPGQATTDLCPLATFDGEPLYRDGAEPDAAAIERRRAAYHAPYHAALAAELARLRAEHAQVVLFDAHSIRSRIPRLFAGELPVFNIGTNDGRTGALVLASNVARIAAATGLPSVIDGRFKGGWTTRHYGRPDQGIHAIQLELAMRGYLAEPDAIDEANWPPAYCAGTAAPMRETLRAMLTACLAFTAGDPL